MCFFNGPGKSQRSRRGLVSGADNPVGWVPGLPRSAGFTVIELAVSILIVVILITVVIVNVGGLFRADLKTSSEKIAASVRYLYNLSVINNMSYRLVVDMENGEYWGEELPREGTACDTFLMDSDETLKKKANQESTRKGGRKSKSVDVVSRAFGRDGEDAGEEGSSGGAFSQVRDNLLTRRELGKRIQFEGVLVAHQKAKLSEGKVEIHFFPSGYVERAYIYLTDGDHIYTIETKSLQGTAVLHREELSASEFKKNNT